MDVQLPDGTTVKGVPDGTSKADLAQKLKANGRTVPDDWLKPAAPSAAPEPPKPERSFGENLMRQGGLTARASIKAVAAPGEMLGSAMGMDTSGAVDRLMKRVGIPEPETGTERMVGSAASGVAGAMLPTGVASLAKPVSSMGKGIAEALQARPMAQAASGATSGAAGQGAAEMGAGPGGQLAASLAGGALPFAVPGKGISTPPSSMSQADAANASVRAKGFLLPPTQVNPSLMNRIVEGWGGKWATQQELSIKDQPKVNALARRAIGLKEDAPLDEAMLDAVRAEAGKPYAAIKKQTFPVKLDAKFIDEAQNLTGDYQAAQKRWPDLFKDNKVEELQASLLTGRMTTTEAIELVKTLRYRATIHFKAFDNPESRALAHAEREAANSVDDLIGRVLTKNGKPELAQEYKDGRTRIAQTYDVQAALNDFTGNVDARKLAAMSSKRPLSGALKDIAEFGSVGRKVAAPPETFGGHPGINPLDIGLAGVQAAMGKPGAAARGVGIAAGRPLAAKVGSSEWYQNRFVNPPGSTRSPSGFPPALLEQLMRLNNAPQ